VGRELGQLPDKDLAYFTEGTQHFDDYVEDVGWAQDYAMTNRREMMRLVLDVLQASKALAMTNRREMMRLVLDVLQASKALPAFTTAREAINCHHNYVQKETHFGAEVYLTRKGAISAQLGQLGIIPGSMGAKSYIVRGLGNAQSFCSCSHGAGRRMSRSEAKRRFDALDLEAQTQGIECRKDKGVVDEIPGAYKDIDVVMQNQSDLVEVVHTLKQVICVKG